MKKVMFVWIVVLLILPTSSYAQSQTVLAIVGEDSNIYLYDFETATTTALTQDAAPRRQAYNWPTWSTDGQLAFFGTSRDYPFEIYLVRPNAEPERVYESAEEIFTYAYWSPADCAETSPCRDLAVLYTRGDGRLALRDVRVTKTYEITELSVGNPHYWDWSPDGTQMFWARFGNRLELFDVESEAIIETFPEQQGLQAAVDWSPVDDRLLTAVAAENNTSNLVILNGDKRQVLVEGLRASVAFEWSPDGLQIAYLDNFDGTLTVLDSATSSVVKEIAEEVILFLWSPDGSQIVYLTFFRPEEEGPSAKHLPQQELLLRWNIYDFAADSKTAYPAFTPTSQMLYYFNFFDQFARSHRLWSPDSQYFVYAEQLADGSSQISLLDSSTLDGKITTIAEGTLAIFSWGG